MYQILLVGGDIRDDQFSLVDDHTVVQSGESLLKMRECEACLDAARGLDEQDFFSDSVLPVQYLLDEIRIAGALVVVGEVGETCTIAVASEIIFQV